MRTFLSYDIKDDSFSSKILALQSELKSTGADLKLVPPDIMHFTIRFLGEIRSEDKERIVEKLSGKVEDFELDVSFKGIGTFPDERRISVIWVGVDSGSAKALEDQAKMINSLLREVPGLPKEEARGFSPHITISRVKTGRNKDVLMDAIKNHKDDDFGTIRIKNLRLKLSELTPEGPHYTDLHVFEK